MASDVSPKSDAEVSSQSEPATKSNLAQCVLSVIIISYNTRQMTLDCLRSLYEDLGDLPAEVFVVDNASTDDSVAAVREAYTSARVIANANNVGFGAANNQAMRLATGELIMLLNSDAFPKPGAIKALIEYLRQHPAVGVVGPKLLNADGSTQQSCFRFPSPGQCWRENFWISALSGDHAVLGDYRHWPHDRERNVEWIVGACMLLRKQVYEATGGFDERFFMYSEETDWQRRIRDTGWEIAFYPQAVVTHFGGASGAHDRVKVSRYFFDSLDRYELKHHGVIGLISLRVAMVLGCLMRGVLWSLALLFHPRRRPKASQKIRLHWGLFVRQLTSWGIFTRHAQAADNSFIR
jgi:GT2 family glycosyltransferase